MNPMLPDLMYNGIFICLSLQLILFGISKVITGTYRNSALGVFCIIMGVIYFYNLYWPDFNHNIWYNILFGGQKDIFYAPLIFLYVAMAKKEREHIHFVMKHLTIPFLLHGIYLVLKFGFKEFYNQNLVSIFMLIVVAKAIIAIIYLSKSISIFEELQLIIKQNIVTRYKWITIGFISYTLIFIIYDIILIAFSVDIPIEVYKSLLRYVYNPLGILMKSGVLIFGILESQRLKKFMFGSRIYTDYELVDNDEDLQFFVNTYFEEQKIFKDESFILSTLLKEKNIDERRFRLFLKKEYNKTTTDFVNDWRIEEFKSLLREGQNSKYDLAGLAKQVGFNSKSTFYRNFKNKEGKTPKEYLKQQLITT